MISVRKHAAAALRRLRTTDAVGIERKRIASEFLAELRRHDSALDELHDRIKQAVTAADTTVTDVHGVGQIVACYLIGYTGAVARFATAGHYARYNATAPIEASSGPIVRAPPQSERQPPTQPHDPHRRARPEQSRHPRSHAFYLRKQGERKTRKEAMRCLKRRMADTMSRGYSPTLSSEVKRPGKTPRGDSHIQRGRQIPEHRHFGSVIPGPNTNARTHDPVTSRAHRPRPNARPDHPLDTNRLRSGGVTRAPTCR